MSDPIYTLRLATMSDAEFLFGVIVSVRQPYDELDPEEVLDPKEDFPSFKKRLERDLGTVWVIEHAGSDVGRLRVEYGDDIYVGGLQIMPDYQSRGIGSAILKDLKAKALQGGIPIKLEVFEKNRGAYRLYSRHGFTEDEQHPNPGYVSLTYLPF